MYIQSENLVLKSLTLFFFFIILTQGNYTKMKNEKKNQIHITTLKKKKSEEKDL